LKIEKTVLGKGLIISNHSEPLTDRVFYGVAYMAVLRFLSHRFSWVTDFYLT
jgi:hypothetical protein